MSGKTLHSIKTSPAHRAYTLIKFAYPLFGYAIFIVFWGSDFWFAQDLSGYGIAIVILVLVIAHLGITMLESERCCRFFIPVLNGRPLLSYFKWLELVDFPEESAGDKAEPIAGNETAASTLDDKQSRQPYIQSGLRRISIASIDELHLSFFGNLVFRSRALCGSLPDANAARKQANPSSDVVLKLAYSAISTDQAKSFIQTLQRLRPDLYINKRLQKKLANKIVKGEDYVNLVGALFLVFVLFDCGYSLAVHLEMLKHYYLAQLDARQGTVEFRQEAERHLLSADQIIDTPRPLSVVTRLLLNRGLFLGTTYQAKAETLYYLGKRKEAIALLQKAVQQYPRQLKWHTRLKLVRWYLEANEDRQARALLLELMDELEDKLSPRLYMLLAVERSAGPARADRFYDIFMDQFDVDVFGDEPRWPPGNVCYLTDYWTRDDLHFLLPTLLKKGDAHARDDK